MSLDALLATLEREAEEDAAARLARAREEAARIVAAGEARVAALQEARRREAAATHARRTAGALGQAVRVARTRELEAQARLLAQVRARAEDRLRAIPDSEWLPLVPALLEAGLHFGGPGAVGIHCPPGVVAAIRELAPPGDITVHADPDLAPGLELRRDDGTVRIRLTLPDRLGALWPDLRVQVLDRVVAS